jgi:hypothetical protein
MTSDEIKHPPGALIGETASLFFLLGGMAAKHLVIVGGLVPPLLLPKAADTHIGSADIDLCLSLAITKGATREYYRSIEEVLEPYCEALANRHGGARSYASVDATTPPDIQLSVVPTKATSVI